VWCWRLQPITATIYSLVGVKPRQPLALFSPACSKPFTDARGPHNLFRDSMNAVLVIMTNIMSNAVIDAPQFPIPEPHYRDWSVLDTLGVGDSLTFAADLYSSLHNACLYRMRRDNRKYTQRQRGETIIVWRLA
jgi:hypothetical protein